MGLGLHGGGLATAQYCLRHGAQVTVTDLKSETQLDTSVSGLDPSIRMVLGEHRESDFTTADIVVKNPAVPRTSPYLTLARRVETDISLFLASFTGPLYAITGTKGKSTTVSALHRMIVAEQPDARLGGNITISPLSFCDEIAAETPVVLELSSFQLGDLMLTPLGNHGCIRQLKVSGITNILPDHQDYYGSMDAYVADKRIIFELQPPTGSTVLGGTDPYSKAFAPETNTVRLDDHAELDSLIARSTLPGAHHRRNLFMAAACARLAGITDDTIRREAQSFTGIAHRMELVATIDGRRYVNDSAATIPEATAAAIAGFSTPVHLIAGGSDKRLTLDAFRSIASSVASLQLLDGSATRVIAEMLDRAGIRFGGPHPDLRSAVEAATAASHPDETVLLSPGCASFGMFRNEFDRGDQFKAIVCERTDTTAEARPRHEA